MAIFRVGEEFDTPVEVCRCSSREECLEKCDKPIKPCFIYTFKLVIEPPIKKEEAWRFYDVIRIFHSRHPGIIINYLEVSDDGKTIIVQVFDPPQQELGVPSIVWVLLALTAALVAAGFFLDKFRAFVLTLKELIPTPPKYIQPFLWGAITLIAFGFGFMMLAWGISRLRTAIPKIELGKVKEKIVKGG